MRKPLMPKATASWLIENTTLSFKQISEFVDLHMLEIQAIADDEVSSGILPRNPIEHGELTLEEIKNCEKDESKNLNIKISDIPDKPNGIYWLVKNLPNIPDSKICKLIGTTKKTVQSIRDRSYWNIQNIRSQNPYELGLCTKTEIEDIIEKYKNTD